jgi:hypothetical protein
MRTLALVGLLSLVTPFVPSQSTPPGIPDALRIQAKDPAAAAKILEGVTTREPNNGRAWRLLGVALQQSKQFDRAIAAYLKAIELGPDPVATYNIGTAYARKNDADKAFEWLTKARDTRRMDMMQMEVDPDLAALRADPRYKALLPAPEDFAKPFVENTTILAEWHGEAANDQFGWIARPIGDVDKDGAVDVAVSAPFTGSQAQPAGRVYVYSSKSRKLLWKADGAPGDRLGWTLEAAGDVDANGIPDVVAAGGGAAVVYSGVDGTVLRRLKSPGTVPIRAVSTAGDVDRDGHADILAGATPFPPQGAATPAAPSQVEGNAYVFSGRNGSVLLTLRGERAGDNFGGAVAGFSNARQTLLVIGAASGGPPHAGRVYVYTSLSSKPAFTMDADDTGAAFGAMFVAIAGDVNADGMKDVYASDFPNRAKGPSTGRVYVHSGKDGSRLLTLTGEGPGEGFGTSASYAGDIDGDGHDDLAVGAWQYAREAISGGRIYLHSGKDGRLLRTITCRIPGDTLGFDSVGIGDVDGDGTVDLLLTSAYSGINGYQSGRVFIVSSGLRGRVRGP